MNLEAAHERQSRSAGTGRARGGYSLLEVVVALLVLAVGVVGCFGFFSHGSIMLNVENHKRTAAEIAYSRQEELRTAAPNALASHVEDGFAVDIDGLPGERDTAVVDVDEDGDGDVDYRQVTVTVSWPEKGATQAVSLVTFRSAHR